MIWKVLGAKVVKTFGVFPRRSTLLTVNELRVVYAMKNEVETRRQGVPRRSLGTSGKCIAGFV